MRVLVHYPAPGTAPVGVWWLPGSRTAPRSAYAQSSWHLDGARAVLGTDYDGEPLTLANWNAICDRLTGTQSPFRTFTDHETKSPESLLLSRPDA